MKDIKLNMSTVAHRNGKQAGREERDAEWVAMIADMKNDAEMCMYGDPDKEISEQESTVWATQLSVLEELKTRMEVTG